ncbi:MAG: hypothetical protein CBC09_07680 [Cellvibrionales bacterium TMED49]|nr:DNA polymerase III subunit gamma/tau [Porticoccaceae bacterium]OUU37018.1 MAG: hypothetical protein CBC09_07680 [Cellvibrionales bacterium TMED49]
MSYQVLARKWRPKDFSEMAGQEHVLRVLSNSLNNNRLHHAYLFAGTRGVGKTTIARVLSKCLNCESGISATPCGSCSSCVEMNEGRSIDFIEVDAASKTKVEDTRDLLDRVHYAPSKSRFTIYLIDEAHMLSANSFNALLKTLEEPPSHVKFLLATTDPKKLPVTILSRCIQFNLKNLAVDKISKHLKFILADEKIPFEDEAVGRLARAANGSMRDALTLTDQAVGYGDGRVLSEYVSVMLGSITKSFIIDIFSALAERNGKELLKNIETMAEHAPDYDCALGDILILLHEISVHQIVPESCDKGDDNNQVIANLAKKLSKEDIQLFYQICLLGRNDLQMTPDPRIGFEMIMLRALAFRPEEDRGDNPTKKKYSFDNQTHSGNNKIAKKDDGYNLTKSSRQPSQITVDESIAIQDEKQSSGLSKEFTSDEKVDFTLLEKFEAGHWSSICKQLDIGGALGQIVKNCIFSRVENDKLFFVLDSGYTNLLSKRHESALADLLSTYFARTLQVSIDVGIVEMDTPRLEASRSFEDNKERLIVALNEDAQIKHFKQLFDGSIEMDSIVPKEV